jgi:hypothetical protein
VVSGSAPPSVGGCAANCFLHVVALYAVRGTRVGSRAATCQWSRRGPFSRVGCGGRLGGSLGELANSLRCAGLRQGRADNVRFMADDAEPSTVPKVPIKGSGNYSAPSSLVNSW